MTPAERMRDVHDPGYDEWVDGEAARLACEREDLRARYPDDDPDDDAGHGDAQWMDPGEVA